MLSPIVTEQPHNLGEDEGVLEVPGVAESWVQRIYKLVIVSNSPLEMSRYPTKADHLSEILDLYPDEERWCAGYAPSKGRRCHNPISGANRVSAVRLLDEGSGRMRQGEDIDDLLVDLASLVLCRHVHQKDQRSQVPALVKKWQDRIRSVSEDLDNVEAIGARQKVKHLGLCRETDEVEMLRRLNRSSLSSRLQPSWHENLSLQSTVEASNSSKGEGVIGRSVWQYHHNLFTACSVDHGAAWVIHCSCTEPSCFYLILTVRLSAFRLFAITAFTSISFNFKLFTHYPHPNGQPPCYCCSSFQLSRFSDYFDVGFYFGFYVHYNFHHLTYKRQSKSKSCYHLWLWTYRNGFLSRASSFAAGISSVISPYNSPTITVSTSSSTITASPTTSTSSPRVSVSNVEPEASASGPTGVPARPRTASTTATPAASTSAPTTLASTSTTTASARASSTSSPTSAPTTAPTVPAQTATATANATPEPTTATSQPDTSSPAVVLQPPRSSSSSISSTTSAVSAPSPLVSEPAYTPTRQPITGDCSICYEPLLPDSPFTTPRQAARDLSIVYCKQQCGTNFHFSCLFTWKKTASQMGRKPSCPMCRAAWS
ncbi:hypothetical protein BO82DRAFT_435920 [Aspergillus uvarum CBS 121591]|uniref:RING-type domain-containing protein n=1 Tax=Aspergillus uvarum CBS 121591 TaxID=1448315 RepID=A0A319BXD3_9EURO|nr:hypothetical protein BO82DRAFT_435920 [Aspergillus uvarum CBS 121591]PYH77385.1 hypothetical protein BO82DRAFT_435920 [Aspergillus uvarum CBS 121591]